MSIGVSLGTQMRDRVTGFVGMAVARTERLYGCVRIAIQSAELKDGKPIEPQWFDEAQLTETPSTH